MQKPVLRVLAGETLPIPPVWLMRQAGRYLPEYRAARARAGSFLKLCYNTELATEVTLQPIRRFGFDAAIVFADILLLPHALGARLTFPEGIGPRLSVIRTSNDFNVLAGPDDIHDHLLPVYRTIRATREELPETTALIGFAGAPWTVATYMIAGRGTADQEPAHALIRENPVLFDRLIERLTESTVGYLTAQARAGADVLKIFDSWAGSLLARSEQLFDRYCTRVHCRIIATLKSEFPDLPVICFPRGAGMRYPDFLARTRVCGLAIDTEVDVEWAARTLQARACVQGNLDPLHLVTGGQEMQSEIRRIKTSLSGGPHIFNLGHGIRPDTNPANVSRLLEVVRERQ